MRFQPLFLMVDSAWTLLAPPPAAAAASDTEHPTVSTPSLPPPPPIKTATYWPVICLMGCKGKVSVSIIHPQTINHIIWSPGECASLWRQKVSNWLLYNVALMGTGGVGWVEGVRGHLPPQHPPPPPLLHHLHSPPHHPTCWPFVQISHLSCFLTSPSSPSRNIRCPALWLQKKRSRRGLKRGRQGGTEGEKRARKRLFCGQRQEAVEGNWLLLTRGCQNGDALLFISNFSPQIGIRSRALQCLKHHFPNLWCGKHDLIPVQCFSSDSPSLQSVFVRRHIEGVIAHHSGWWRATSSGKHGGGYGTEERK